MTYLQEWNKAIPLRGATPHRRARGRTTGRPQSSGGESPRSHQPPNNASSRHRQGRAIPAFNLPQSSLTAAARLTLAVQRSPERGKDGVGLGLRRLHKRHFQSSILNHQRRFKFKPRRFD